MRSQGTQNGGIDGAPLGRSMPGGVREIMAENLIAVWLDLECASGNDARHSESDMRVAAKVLPYLVGGSDLICSGFGSILKYDNSFNPSSFNGEELEEFLVLQRDFEVDGGLKTVEDSEALSLRKRAIDALAHVLQELNLARTTSSMKQSVAVASGSNDTKSFKPRDVALISEKIKNDGINVIDIIKSLHNGGFVHEAENLLFLVKLRVSGDYLQTSAIIRDARVLSAINDPNNYTGPGTGYRPSEQRKKELAAIRDVLDRDEVLRTEALNEMAEMKAINYKRLGRAEPGEHPFEVVVGISPAFGSKIFRTLAGHKLSSVLKALQAGIIDGGAIMRLVKFWHTADTSFLGLSAARISGSGIGIGLQAKGTAVIHHKSRLPHNNLELFSNAPITKLNHYESMGYNAARYCKKELPDPVIVPTKGEALGARFHAKVALIYAIETSMTTDNATPELLDYTFLEVQTLENRNLLRRITT